MDRARNKTRRTSPPGFAAYTYHLIIIDCEISGMTATEFARIINESAKWKATQLIVITGSRGRSSATELLKYGGFLVKRSVWRKGVSKLSANFKRSENDGSTLAFTEHSHTGKTTSAP